MSATTEESSPLNDYLVTGETFFVAGAVLAFLSDVALTFRSLVTPNAVGVLVGCTFIVGTLYVINWLYSGQKEARMPAITWASLQILIALVATALMFNHEFHWNPKLDRVGDIVAPALSVPSPWLGLFKVFAYGVFLSLLVQRGPALFFLRHRGGEHVEAPSPTAPPEDIHPTGVTIPLTAEQQDKADLLASTMQNAAVALMAAGVFEAIVGCQRLAAYSTRNWGWIGLAEGIVLFALGLVAMGPIVSVRDIKDRGTDTAYITDACANLRQMLFNQTILTLAIVGLTVAAMLLRLLKS